MIPIVAYLPSGEQEKELHDGQNQDNRIVDQR